MYLFAFSVFSPLETGSAHILPTLSLGREQGYCILQHKGHSLKHFLPFYLWSSEGAAFGLLLLIYLFFKGQRYYRCNDKHEKHQSGILFKAGKPSDTI